MGVNDMVERISIDIERDRAEEELFHDCQEEVGSAEDEKRLDKGKYWIQRSLFIGLTSLLKMMVVCELAAMLHQ